jgi:hypothetical protein
VFNYYLYSSQILQCIFYWSGGHFWQWKHLCSVWWGTFRVSSQKVLYFAFCHSDDMLTWIHKNNSISNMSLCIRFLQADASYSHSSDGKIAAGDNVERRGAHEFAPAVMKYLTWIEPVTFWWCGIISCGIFSRANRQFEVFDSWRLCFHLLSRYESG